MIGQASFPCTTNVNGTQMFKKTQDVVITLYRPNDNNGDFITIPKSVDSPSTATIYLPAAFVGQRKDLKRGQLESLNRDSMFSIEQAIQVAMRVMDKLPSDRPLWLSIPVTTETSLAGSSLGFATLAALLGFDQKVAGNPWVLTGYVTSLGMKEEGLQALNAIVHSVDSVPQKIHGVCGTMGKMLLCPFDTLEDVLKAYQVRTNNPYEESERGSSQLRVDSIAISDTCCIPFVTLGDGRAYFVKTIKQAVDLTTVLTPLVRWKKITHVQRMERDR